MASLDHFRRLTLLKKLLWLYSFLLIFAGALCKWAVPQLSDPAFKIATQTKWAPAVRSPVWQ